MSQVPADPPPPPGRILRISGRLDRRFLSPLPPSPLWFGLKTPYLRSKGRHVVYTTHVCGPTVKWEPQMRHGNPDSGPGAWESGPGALGPGPANAPRDPGIGPGPWGPGPAHGPREPRIGARASGPGGPGPGGGRVDWARALGPEPMDCLCMRSPLTTCQYRFDPPRRTWATGPIGPWEVRSPVSSPTLPLVVWFKDAIFAVQR